MNKNHASTETLSIIIVSWNTRELLCHCLNSIYDSAPATKFDIWVVDNNSTDGSVEMIEERFNKVNVIKNEVNVGFARANNQAIAASTGHYTLLINPDTEVKRYAIDKMVSFLSGNCKVGIVGSRVLHPDGTLQPSCYPTPTLARESWRMFHLDRLKPYGAYDMSKWDTASVREVDAVLGACLMVKRQVLEEIGLLDSNYFMYTEEIDLCYRAQQGGWQICWIPQAEIIHHGGQSTKQVASKMFLNLYASKIQFFRKHYGQSTTRMYKYMLFCSAIVRLLLSPAAILISPARRQERQIDIQNYKRLILALPSM